MESVKKINWKHILFILGIIGPGIITATVDNDAGGITTYSVAGAHFGYSLLWSLIPITILLVIVQEMVARIGAVTGKGLADLIRENFGIKITFFIMIGLVFANLFVTLAEFAGIAAAGELFGISRFVLVPIAAFLVWFLILKLDYKILEKFFFVVIFLYIAYIISGFMAKPPWGTALKEFVMPTIHFSKGYLFLLIAVIGTTITPWMQFYLQSSIVEKGIRKEEYKYSRWDVIIGSITTDVVSFFIIVTCSAVLFTKGIRIESAVDAAQALQPFAGQYATMLFAIGFFAAALFGAFILPIATAYYVCEAFGWESGVNKKFKQAKSFYILLSLMIFVSAAAILIPNINLIYLMLLAQFMNGILLPVILIVILKLVNDKKLMGDYRNSRWMNIVAWTGCVLIIGVSAALLVTTVMGG
ncbi:MAG: Nramp family divalent metal transporter [Nanoarchaeota archaeon]|nr:Nramp family divalent metal transporter [Nanoarchaeota archaeon]MBU1005215.1 Nramp family divalent metal transporter [Nanoarchaeota archaeon]MBU1946886.1 Nramp family divalent metal transporter [Nanoarchaeota archaeon]